MGSAAWNPVVVYVGSDDETQRKQAQAIIASLGDDRVTDLGGGSWRVFEIDMPTQEAAVAAVGRLLDEVDPRWQNVFEIAWEE